MIAIAVSLGSLHLALPVKYYVLVTDLVQWNFRSLGETLQERRMVSALDPSSVIALPCLLFLSPLLACSRLL